MYLCELALEMGMTLRELGHRASNYEVCVTWPAFMAARAELADWQEKLVDSVSPEEFNKQFESQGGP